MRNPVVVVGVGEMGSVFARGFLRAGHPVFPVTRNMNMVAVAEELAAKQVVPKLVLIAVAEADLHPVLQQLPAAWFDRLVLLQNELLPNDWRQYGLEPTVVSVWFEKKKGMDSKVIIPSPVHGKRASDIAEALVSIDIATHVLLSREALLFELVLKNVYILTTNIAGLQVGGNVGELWANHREVALAVANEVILLQQVLNRQEFDSAALIEGMVKAFNGDLNHQCMGRSAPGRLARALDLAEQNGLQLQTLKTISEASLV
jgi:ketopantoate reductase